jgi:5,10-methylenetetrahydromethanopterin reductase
VTSVRFGLQLHGTLPIAHYAELAARAEALGFEDVTVHDVLLRRPVWPLLCDVARATTTVRVGPNVTHPFLQHPATIAANLAHLDELSDGRAVLGLGRGSLYELVATPPPRDALAGLEEATRVVRALVAGSDVAASDEAVTGQRFALGAGAALCFGTRRAVPVTFGVLGEAGVRLAGRVADGVRPAAQWDPAYAQEMRRWLTDAATAAGRAPGTVDLVLENWTVLDADRDRARRLARRVLATFLPHLGPLLEFYEIPAGEVEAARRASVDPSDERELERISDATIDHFMAAGDRDDLRRGLDRIAAAGFDAVSFSGVLGPDPHDALEMLGDELVSRWSAS